ncbi:hypothetical protein M0R45_019622 [Rubus argutus]|uniref:Uncharacterized protein n=1 Tax=Rubus argutus TaxID=59490 RepID=A0AAW1X8P3_RUBAR
MYTNSDARAWSHVRYGSSESAVGVGSSPGACACELARSAPGSSNSSPLFFTITLNRSLEQLRNITQKFGLLIPNDFRQKCEEFNLDYKDFHGGGRAAVRPMGAYASSSGLRAGLASSRGCNE